MELISEKTLKLVELNGNEDVQIYDMLQRIGPDENAFNNEVHGMSFDQFRNWLNLQLSWANGNDLPEGYVRQWTYWLFDGRKPVGYGKLRERVTEKSRVFGGNIGFAIDPIFRGRGYGLFLFDALLNEAHNKGIKEIVSTVELENNSSKIIHEKCGGKIIEVNSKRYIFDFSERLKVQ